jgi:ParB family chromosome partitioning protein
MTSPQSNIHDTTRTIAEIRLSPHNVRTDESDTSDTSELEASILASGLMQPICVHPMRGSTSKFGAFAGGRRYRAIRALIERGDLPAEWPVRVREHVGFSDAKLIELSLVENLPRKDLREYEKFAAARKLHRLGETVEEIAEAIGREPLEVRRWLKMGELAGTIFAAMKSGEISIAAAQAYAARADHALQLHAWRELEATGGRDAPREIREALKVNDAQARRLLRYVGDEAYRAAGGRFELDLFAEDGEERGAVVDEGLLQSLADAQIEAERATVRDLTGRPDLRFVPAPPQNDFRMTDWPLQVQPKLGELGRVVLPEGAIVACIEIDEDGEAATSYWWESRKAKFGTPARPTERTAPVQTLSEGIALDDRASPGAASQAGAAVREAHGVAGDGLHAIRHLRQAILRGLLVADANRGGLVGQHYATWAALRGQLSSDGTSRIGARGISTGYTLSHDRPSDQTRAILEETPAQSVWTGAIAELAQHSSMTEPDLSTAFIDYYNAGDAFHRLAGAVVAGYALERSANAPGFSIAVHDAVAQMARGTAPMVRRLWRPSEAFLGLFPARQLLDLVETLVEPETWRRWAKLRTPDLRAAIARAFGPSTNGVRTGAKAEASEWVHPLLRFEPIDFSKPAAADPTPLETYLSEAAE